MIVQHVKLVRRRRKLELGDALPGSKQVGIDNTLIGLVDTAPKDEYSIVLYHGIRCCNPAWRDPRKLLCPINLLWWIRLRVRSELPRTERVCKQLKEEVTAWLVNYATPCVVLRKESLLKHRTLIEDGGRPIQSEKTLCFRLIIDPDYLKEW